MAENQELLVNLRNRQRADVPLSDHASVVRESTIEADPRAAERADKQRLALARLKIRAAAGDETLADLLLVLGLALWGRGP